MTKWSASLRQISLLSSCPVRICGAVKCECRHPRSTHTDTYPVCTLLCTFNIYVGLCGAFVVRTQHTVDSTQPHSSKQLFILYITSYVWIILLHIMRRLSNSVQEGTIEIMQSFFFPASSKLYAYMHDQNVWLGVWWRMEKGRVKNGLKNSESRGSERGIYMWMSCV